MKMKMKMKIMQKRITSNLNVKCMTAESYRIHIILGATLQIILLKNPIGTNLKFLILNQLQSLEEKNLKKLSDMNQTPWTKKSFKIVSNQNKLVF
jgi:hypothetical protein